MSNDLEYTEDMIEVLPVHEAIRRRPYLYIEKKYVLNSLIEAATCIFLKRSSLRKCSTIKIALQTPDEFTIADDGDGYPMEINPDTGRYLLDELLTDFRACRLNMHEETSLQSLCTLEIVIAVALCRRFVVRNRFHDMAWEGWYENGQLVRRFERMPYDGPAGLEFVLTPDLPILGRTEFSLSIFCEWLDKLPIKASSLAIEIHGSGTTQCRMTARLSDFI